MRVGDVLVGVVVALRDDAFDGLEALDEFGLPLPFDLERLDVLARGVWIGEERLLAVEDVFDVVVYALEAAVAFEKVVGLVRVVEVRVALPLYDEAKVLGGDVFGLVETVLVALVADDAFDDVLFLDGACL